MDHKIAAGRRNALLGGLVGVLAFALAIPAHAEVDEVRLVRQFGIHYLPLIVMEHEKLVEKQAAARGMPDLNVTRAQLSGGATVNDALLSGRWSMPPAVRVRSLCCGTNPKAVRAT